MDRAADDRRIIRRYRYGSVACWTPLGRVDRHAAWIPNFIGLEFFRSMRDPLRLTRGFPAAVVSPRHSDGPPPRCPDVRSLVRSYCRHCLAARGHWFALGKGKW